MDSIQCKVIATRFVKFVIVGSIGALIVFGTTTLLTEVANLHYMLSLAIAIPLATIWNFTLNLKWTFNDKGRSND